MTKWTDEEKEILENAFKNRIPIFTIEELRNKTEKQISQTARRMGLFDRYPDFDQNIGKTHYQLTILKKVGRQYYGHPYYECLCTCGNKTVVNLYNLRKGHTKSCGCLWKNMERKPPSTYKNLIGQKFGMLTVLERGENWISPTIGSAVRFWCQCDCGKKVLVFSTTLLNGGSTSCGCNAGKLRRKYNRYDISGEYGIGYDSVGNKFYFDLEDYDKIKGFLWRISNYGYVVSTDLDNGGGVVFFHRVVMGLYPGNIDKKIDHIIAENKNDNRKSNLRIVTSAENSRNVGLKSNNTSGVTGVYFGNKNGKWIASIGYNRKLIYLGSFDNFDDAVAARKAAEDKYFGEYSYDNSQALGKQVNMD